MIVVKTNSASIIGKLTAKVTSISQADQLLRTLATNTRAAMKQRIHVDGFASDGAPIGRYSDAYMKVRTGKYSDSNSSKKGVVKSAGKFTKGKNKGAERPRYNRTADTKVVISLTRQMENDMVVVATARGYGIGYNNVVNFNKAAYVEHTYRKKIFALTSGEKEMIKRTAIEFVKNNA